MYSWFRDEVYINIGINHNPTMIFIIKILKGVKVKRKTKMGIISSISLGQWPNQYIHKYSM